MTRNFQYSFASMLRGHKFSLLNTTPATESSDSETGVGEEEESLGASGSSGAEWSGAEE